MQFLVRSLYLSFDYSVLFVTLIVSDAIISDKLVSNDRVAFIHATFSLYYTRRVINLFYSLRSERYFIPFNCHVFISFIYYDIAITLTD